MLPVCSTNLPLKAWSNRFGGLRGGASCDMPGNLGLALNLRSQRFKPPVQWKGSPQTQLVFRGQVDTTGAFPRALTIIVGQPLSQTVCKVGEVDFCSSSPRQIEASPRTQSQDLADHVAYAMESRNKAAKEEGND